MLAGGNVQQVANEFGIASQDAIDVLQYVTIYSDAPNTAGAALLAGESLDAVASRFGITTPDGLRDLEERRQDR